MEKTKRIFTFLTFLICTACIALLSASLATHKWIVVKPVRSTLLASNPELLRDENGHTEVGKFKGNIYFGLFQGTKILNHGFGDRVVSINMKDELLRNPNLMPFGLWLCTVLCVAIAILFGLVACIFAVINTVMTPIEVITGMQGLYLWNGMGAIFSTGACISWLIQFRTKLRKNVLTQAEVENGWSSEHRAKLGFSFYLVAISVSLFMFNILLLVLASRKPCKRKMVRPITDKSPEGVIMLY